MNDSVDIVGASCAIPSGPTLPLADCALRTPLALLRKHPFYLDQCGIGVKASYFPHPDLGFDTPRWCALASTALNELASMLAAKQNTLPRRRRLWLVLPRANRGGVPSDLVDKLFKSMRQEGLDWDQIKAIRGGHAVGVHAIRQAADAAAREDDLLTVVLAIDSWLHPEALEALERDRLLHGAHAPHEGRPRQNPYGRVPGEGAAALALMRPLRKGDRSATSQALSWAAIAGAAIAEEPLGFNTPGPCIGLGLTQAAQTALNRQRSPAASIGHVSTDLNGEPYRGDEFGFTILRLAHVLSPCWKRTSPAIVSGDLGAAASIAQLALAAFRIRHRTLDTPARHLILCSSDDSLRAAAILDTPAHAQAS